MQKLQARVVSLSKDDIAELKSVLPKTERTGKKFKRFLREFKVIVVQVRRAKAGKNPSLSEEKENLKKLVNQLRKTKKNIEGLDDFTIAKLNYNAVKLTAANPSSQITSHTAGTIDNTGELRFTIGTIQPWVEEIETPEGPVEQTSFIVLGKELIDQTLKHLDALTNACDIVTSKPVRRPRSVSFYWEAALARTYVNAGGEIKANEGGDFAKLISIFRRVSHVGNPDVELAKQIQRIKKYIAD